MDTKKIIVALLAWTWIGQGAVAQPDSIQRVLDSSITLLRTYALHNQRPDWDYVRERAYGLAGEATRWEDLGPAISWLFEAVNDHHGWLAIGNRRLRWERPEPPFLSEAIRNGLAKGQHMVRMLLPGNIGYLRVPGMLDERMMDSLAALETEGARKLIIDLRLDSGESVLATPPDMSRLVGTRMPVVVLTGHGTGSAGESVAMAFRGRKRTIFIGEPTAGYGTAVSRHSIVDGKVEIVIAETMLIDRKRRTCPHNLIPDEWVPGGDDFEVPGMDKKVQAAISWLRDF